MINLTEFILQEKSMLIAPAGFGKTHTIAECLKNTQSIGKQLILTHTHAGVASIKEKTKKEGIPSSSFEVETIMSFAQKYVLSFYTGNDVPEQEDSKLYYPFIIEKAKCLFKLNPIKKIISNTYKGLFVDEYQDCTETQHQLILLLSELFPTRILGDPLQGIFGFNEKLIEMNNPFDMKEFITSRYELDLPQRWLNGNNERLGQDLKGIRQLLISDEIIDLTKFSSIETHVCSDIMKEKYRIILELIKNEKSILIIDPNSESIHTRIEFIQKFNNIPRLIESIDAKDFYLLSKFTDDISCTNVRLKLIELCLKLFNTTGVKSWFNEIGVKKKTKPEELKKAVQLECLIKQLEKEISFVKISEFLKEIKSLPEIKNYRKELFHTLCKALEDANFMNSTVIEAMYKKRNLTRRVGRKIYGSCVGTTLLTKGLEFDTVLIINAHKFKCPKHLYVALTRASKRLIIFTNNSTLNPFK